MSAPLSSRLCAELLAELIGLVSHRRQFVGEAGIPFTARHGVLVVLARLGQARVGQVADALHVDMSAASRQLTAMHRDGLVEWRTDDCDRRSHLVSLTAAGWAELERARGCLVEWLRQRLGSWPEADVTALTSLLGQLNRTLDVPVPRPLTSPESTIPERTTA